MSTDFKNYLKNTKQKVKSEDETRKNLLSRARGMGCEKDLQLIMERYDKLLNRTWDAKEREQIGIMGTAEIHHLFGCYGALVVNGKEIIPPDEEYIAGLQGYVEEESTGKIKKIT